MKLRIGEGWDTHALVAGRPLILGGVTIAHSHGLRRVPRGIGGIDLCVSDHQVRCARRGLRQPVDQRRDGKRRHDHGPPTARRGYPAKPS